MTALLGRVFVLLLLTLNEQATSTIHVATHVYTYIWQAGNP